MRKRFRLNLLSGVAISGLCLLFGGSVQAASNVGNGGTVTYTDASGLNPSNEPYADGYVVHTFTTTGVTNFTVPAVAGSLDIEYLLVGGGGSGGSTYGAGGGAGGLLTNAGGEARRIPAGTYAVTVGNGGAGVSGATMGNPGTATSAFGLTASGGGAGGGNGSDGGSGGSGGGASKVAGSANTFAGGICVPDQGNDGGHAAVLLAYNGGGGGGGAGAVGGALAGNTVGGAGGIGVQSSLGGTTNWYAAGGSGVFNTTSASGIGGKCQSGQAAGSGAANTGSGGGGNTSTLSGAGGSGIVIVRYRYVGEMPLLACLTAPAAGKGIYPGTALSTTATVANASAPYTVTFYTNVNGGAFVQAGEPDDSEPYTMDLGIPPAGVYGIYAVATNASESVTSPTNLFTVATDNVAVGGTITYTDADGLNPRSSPPYTGGYVVHTFTTTGTNTLTIPSVADGLGVTYLIVGGGGSGGSTYGGGGGAGAMRSNLGGTPLPVAAGAKTIIVGAGGTGVTGSSAGNPGGASTAFGLKANGGGYGGGANGAIGGGAGGSGGGTSGSSYLSGPGNAGYGNRGGPHVSFTGAGGGGAGSAGGGAVNTLGGVGLQSSISGWPTWYAAGGAGVFNATSANGIGGNCVNGQNGGVGVANTGSGGGANGSSLSGAGGSGIVIVRYPYVYVSGEQVAMPTFEPGAGGYLGATNVTLASTTSGAEIRYTTDGSAPTAESALYSGAIEIPVNTNLTIKAVGFKDGYDDSTVVSATYYTASCGTWANTAGGSWPVAGNWLNGIVGQGEGVPVYFNTLTLAANATVTLDGARIVGSLAFADVGDAYTWTINGGTGGSLTLDNLSTPAISVSNRTATMGVVLAGTNGLSKTGAGTLVFREANTFTGGVTVSGGTLDWQITPNASAGTITVNAGGTAKFHGTYLNYGYTVANDITGNGAVTARGPGGSLQNGAFYVSFTGNVSAFTGTFTVDTTANFVQLPPAAKADGSQAKWVVNRTNSAAYLSVPEPGIYRLGELSGNGALGAFYLSNTTTWVIGALGTDSTFDGMITNALAGGQGIAALTKVGAGKLTLTKSNAYAGGTVVSNGVLEVGISASLGTNFVEVAGGKLSLLGSAAISDAAPLYLPNEADKLELATGVNETVRELTIGGKPAFRGKWGRVGSSWYQTPCITGDGILTVLEGPQGGSLISLF
jgi:autotransporter-associated beta strand protein